MQAIVTRYLGPTNHRGSRIKALASAGSITIDWNYSLSIEGNHKAAAMALASKLDWLKKNRLETGWLPKNSGLVHVLVAHE